MMGILLRFLFVFGYRDEWVYKEGYCIANQNFKGRPKAYLNKTMGDEDGGIDT